MFHRTPSGFMLDFPNGWTASVQFGPGNYCSNRDFSRNLFSDHAQFLESNTAEIASWRTEDRESSTTRNWFTFDDGQEVRGWQNVTHVMEFLNVVSNFHDVNCENCEKEEQIIAEENAKEKWFPGSESFFSI